MTKIKNNPLLKGASGMMGDVMVYREVRGKVVMSNRPKKSTKPASENQQAVRDRFLEAAEYAKAVEADPALKAMYEAAKGDKYLSTTAAAMADYLKRPRITGIDTSQYTGAAGGTIAVKAIKEFKMVSVEVAITGNDGQVIEKGNAEPQLSGRLHWTYVAVAENTAPAGSKITVRAKDTPGNVTTREFVL